MRRKEIKETPRTRLISEPFKSIIDADLFEENEEIAWAWLTSL